MQVRLRAETDAAGVANHLTRFYNITNSDHSTFNVHILYKERTAR